MAHVEAPIRSRRRNAPPRAAGWPRAPRPELDLWFRGDDLGAVRASVTAYTTRLGLDHRVDDVLLVVHELVTNAVRHGGGGGRLRLTRENDRIVCRVTDGGPGLTSVGTRGMQAPAANVAGGRGLVIVRRLAHMGIETGSWGTTVVAALSV